MNRLSKFVISTQPQQVKMPNNLNHLVSPSFAKPKQESHYESKSGLQLASKQRSLVETRIERAKFDSECQNTAMVAGDLDLQISASLNTKSGQAKQI